MGARGRPLFDLNEFPSEEDEQSNGVVCFQPQRTVPLSNSHTSELFATSTDSERILNNNAFSHASSASGFQPFIRPKGAQGSQTCSDSRVDMNSQVASTSKGSNGEVTEAVPQLDLRSVESQVVEKEEGEWSDAEGSIDVDESSGLHKQSVASHRIDSEIKRIDEMMDGNGSGVAAENVLRNDGSNKDENRDQGSLGFNADSSDRKSDFSRNFAGNGKGDVSMEGQEEHGLVLKLKEVKGVEASYALKCANNPGKRPKFDLQKEAMLGKKRSRQTMFLNYEDVKHVGPIKSSIPRRQNFPAPMTTRTVKEGRTVLPPAERVGEKPNEPLIKDPKQVDLSCNDGNPDDESNDSKSERNGDVNSGLLAKPRRLNSVTDLTAEVHSSPISRQISWKRPTESRQLKNSSVSSGKPSLVSQSSMDPKLGNKKLPSKKQTTVGTQYQDTSVERLLREVTNEKFWHHPGPCIAEGNPVRLHVVGVQLFRLLVGWKNNISY